MGRTLSWKPSIPQGASSLYYHFQTGLPPIYPLPNTLTPLAELGSQEGLHKDLLIMSQAWST